MFGHRSERGATGYHRRDETLPARCPHAPPLGRAWDTATSDRLLFARADSVAVADGEDEDTAVADFTGASGLNDGLDGLVHDLSGTTTSISIFGSRLTLYSFPR